MSFDLKPCQCVPGRECAPAPNRSRKLHKGLDWFVPSTKAELDAFPGRWKEAMGAAAAAIGDESLEYEFCQSMEPVVSRARAA